jgi:hypothetical protein
LDLDNTKEPMEMDYKNPKVIELAELLNRLLIKKEQKIRNVETQMGLKKFAK